MVKSKKQKKYLERLNQKGKNHPAWKAGKMNKEEFEPIIPMRKSNFDRLIKEAKKMGKQEALQDELEFLERLRIILNKYHSQFPLVEIGRQNVLNNIDNELRLDERIIELQKQVDKKLKE
jgi:hypothetical protein